MAVEPFERLRPAETAGRAGAAAICLVIAASVAVLVNTPGEVTLRRGGIATALRFLSRAVTPAAAYEGGTPAGASPLLLNALTAAKTTVMFATAAMSLALAGGVLLACLASTAWWDEGLARTGIRAAVARFAGRSLYRCTRVLIALLRSIHELLWAVLLLAAFGVSHLAAILAIAIPYSGILAKVFSEMLDETPRASAAALRDAGASRVQAFLFGLVPRAFPDMAAYAFYRFECALRSSAVLGFFGFPTLGYFIAASFENLHYAEVWTYLYVLFALVAAMDWWSGALRRRFVA